jgi:hypothetical protein
MSHTTDGDAARQGQGDVPHKAGAFDIRVFIASLIGIYGVVLVMTDGVNMNLFAGIGMIIFSAAFLIWARLRPVVVRAVPPDPDGRPPSAH